MKTTFTLTLIVLLALCSSASAQQSRFHDTYEYAETATVTWDSVALASSITPKWLEVRNDGSVNLIIALENDTTAGRTVTIKQNETFTINLLRDRAFLRTKSASSTCLYRIRYLL